MTADLHSAEEIARHAQATVAEEVRGDGFVLTVVSWSDEHRLALERLDARGAKLLSVLPPTEELPQRALVWLPFSAVDTFVRLFEQFATEETRAGSGKPKNEALVANIEELRLSVLREFWQEDEPFPDPDEPRWWEVWLVQLDKSQEPVGELRHTAAEFGWRVLDETLAFPYRTVALVHAPANELGVLLTTNAIPGELRRPGFAEQLFGLDRTFQGELVADLADRIEPAETDAPAVCVLDCGTQADHPLLMKSFDAAYTVVKGTTAAPAPGASHGTEMAGLALYGDLEPVLMGSQPIRLIHRLESVKILRGHHDDGTEPKFYGKLMADAASEVEIGQTRRRVYSMAVTSGEQKGSDGRPTSWSAAIDALAIGTDVQPSDKGIGLLGQPDPQVARLFVVSAGNLTAADWHIDHLAASDTRQISDPAQAWNALTVGAYTERTAPPADSAFAGYRTLAPMGELSPFSRTSVLWSERKGRPIKPDIVLEGGNLLVGPGGELDNHEVVELVTTSAKPFSLLTTANATSAATSQAARLGALVIGRYPSLTPEAVRGLLVHAAEWTPAMHAQFPAPRTRAIKAARHKLLRRYGWGVPTEERVLASAESDVTMIVEDQFRPFGRSAKGAFSMRAMRLHTLPWPSDQLQDLFDARVRMRVTLSYFIEPNPSNRGWQGKYAYTSHGLRFDVIRPTESLAQFEERLSNEAEAEERGVRPTSSTDDRWFLGRARNAGSLHADMWEGNAAALAQCGVIAVYPVGGWWKQNNRRDRVDLPVRYALLVSVVSEIPTDIYTPIASKIEIPVQVEI
ncbi:S8 family peptidase [Sphaerisporangium viridialbum]|uniref:S8 family peptidase n=1 Tax=Sphaerisporangium viridialbum TaxID=46189 RepID=UPI003C750800